MQLTFVRPEMSIWKGTVFLEKKSTSEAFAVYLSCFRNKLVKDRANKINLYLHKEI